MTDSLASPAMPADPSDDVDHSRKGHPVERPEPTPPEQLPAGLRPRPKDPAEAFARTLGAVLTEVLPGATTQALMTALRAEPEQGHVCARCALNRCRWDRIHSGQLREVWEQACEAAGISQDDPAAGSLDLTAYLPGDLKPGAPDGLPMSYPAVTTIAGWELCGMHVAGQEAAQAQREEAEEAQRAASAEAAAPRAAQPQPAGPPAQLLIPPRGMSAATAAAAARQNVPGIPGYAEPAASPR